MVYELFSVGAPFNSEGFSVSEVNNLLQLHVTITMYRSCKR